MAANSGRAFTISKGGTVLAGLRQNSVAVDNSPVNVTDKSDSGYRTLGAFAGERTLDISASGVVKSAELRSVALGTESGLLLTDITIEYDNPADSVSGDFYLQGFTEDGSHDGEATFDGTLQSSGAWTYTPAA